MGHTTIQLARLREDLGKYLDRAAGGERLLVHRFTRPLAAIIPVEDLERLEEPMSEEQKEYKVTRPPSIANRTPRQHARQLLEEQFGGNIPHLRRYLLRMIESLEDMEEQP